MIAVSPKKLARSHNRTIQRHKQCCDVCRCMPTSLFFQLFQSETAITKCKKVCLYGKNTSKILGFFIDALDLFACPWKPLYAVLSKPKSWVKNSERNRTSSSLSKKNCQFWAKNHWKLAKFAKMCGNSRSWNELQAHNPSGVREIHGSSRPPGW